MNGVGDATSGGEPLPPMVTEAELKALFSAFAAYPQIALAVSGGADSTAMMHLARRWLDLTAKPLQLTVLTVDHALRAESAAEAACVAARAATLGLPHHTLVWQGGKPAADLQAAAREARYRLLTGFCREHGIGALATAHTSDDQAETLVMRLKRGSGLDGLAGMAPVSTRDGIALIRPLLGVTRARLEALLRAEGLSWLEDPSNRNDAYERVRIRRALSAAAALGLSGAKLTLSARRLGRARGALEAMTGEFLTAQLSLYKEGFAAIAIDTFFAAPEEIALRALARMAQAFGGRSAAPQLAKLEAGYAKLAARPRMMTLGGCQFAFRGERLLIAREYGRMPRTGLSLAPGATLLWDRRFALCLAADAPEPVTVKPLGPAGCQAVKAAGGDFGATPHIAAITLPSFWLKDNLSFVPFVRFDGARPDGWLTGASAEFAGQGGLFRGARGAGDA